MKISKYVVEEPLPLFAHTVEISLPSDAWILKIDSQNGEIMMWVLVDSEDEVETRRFLVQSTGHTFEYDIDDLIYIDTVQRGPHVWHVFEIAPIG